MYNSKRKAQRLSVPLEPRKVRSRAEIGDRIIYATERAIAPEHEQHVEDSGARRQTRQGDTQGLEDPTGFLAEAEPLGEQSQPVLQGGRLPSLDARERLAHLYEDLGRAGAVLPLLRLDIRVIADGAAKVGDGLSHDVVDRACANLEQIEQGDEPLAPVLELGFRRQTGGGDRWPDPLGELVRWDKAQVLAVHPLQLLRIEDRGLLLQPRRIEQLDHL